MRVPLRTMLKRRSAQLTRRLADEMLRRAYQLADRLAEGEPQLPAATSNPPPPEHRSVRAEPKRSAAPAPETRPAAEPAPRAERPAHAPSQPASPATAARAEAEPTSAPQPASEPAASEPAASEPAASEPAASEPAAQKYGEHLRRIVERRLEALAANKDFESAEDRDEAVHDLRVASRRLRALFEVHGELLDGKLRKKTKRPLKGVTSAVGVLRESDVNAQQLRDLADGAPSGLERAAIEHVLAELEDHRATERRKGKKRLSEIDFDALQRNLQRAVDQLAERAASTPVEQLAMGALEPAIEQVFASMPPRDGIEHQEQLHDMRIKVKKLRYAFELLKPVLGEHYGELHKRTKDLQELLGDHHDRAVLIQLLSEHRDRLVQGGHTTLADGLNAAIARLVEQRIALFRAADAEFVHLDKQRLLGEVRAAVTGDPSGS